MINRLEYTFAVFSNVMLCRLVSASSSWTLQPSKMKALRSFETSGHTNPAVHCLIQIDLNPQPYRCGSLKPRTRVESLWSPGSLYSKSAGNKVDETRRVANVV